MSFIELFKSKISEIKKIWITAPKCGKLLIGVSCSGFIALVGAIVVAAVVLGQCNHTFGDWEIVKIASCGEKGLSERYCLNDCGEKESKELPMIAHTYGDWKESKAPTCIEMGVEESVCSGCADKKTNSIPTVNHSYGGWVVTKESTCAEAGSKEKRCTVCDDTVVSSVAKVSHSFGEWSVTVSPTCLEKGVKECECTGCGETKTQDIASLGHTDGEWITDFDATCTENGKRHQVCSVCTDTIKNESIIAAGHTDGEWVVDNAATCIENGSKHQICSVCNETLNTDVIYAMGHSWGAWGVDSNATCDSDGEQHRNCSICNETEEETIEKLGHEQTTFISAEKIGEEFYGTWNCGRCSITYSTEYEPLSATFSGKSVDLASYGVPYYKWKVNPQGGVGDYSIGYFVYEVWTGKVVLCSGNLLSPNDYCVHFDTKDYFITSRTLAVRVFVYDAVGTVTYDFVLNNGSFGDYFDEWVHTDYQLEFIKNDANNAYSG